MQWLNSVTLEFDVKEGVQEMVLILTRAEMANLIGMLADALQTDKPALLSRGAVLNGRKGTLRIIELLDPHGQTADSNGLAMRQLRAKLGIRSNNGSDLRIQLNGLQPETANGHDHSRNGHHNGHA